jgi:DNA-binding phage protein
MLDMHTSAQSASLKGIPDLGREYTFTDTAELCAFLQHEIQVSKKKYKDIAAKAGCCAQTVSNMASGSTHYPRFGTVMAILSVMGFELVVRES